MYRPRTLSTTIAKVLHLLAAGLDPSAVEEVFGTLDLTVRTWLARGGTHRQKLHQRFFANPEACQLDELWAKVKQSDQEVWVWVAYEAKFKLITVLQLGPRTQQMAYSVVHELISRLEPGCVPVFSSDGLKHYFYALTAHFGEWMKPDEQSKPVWTILDDFAYAQVIKQQRRFRLIKVEHQNVWGAAAEYVARLKNHVLLSTSILPLLRASI